VRFELPFVCRQQNAENCNMHGQGRRAMRFAWRSELGDSTLAAKIVLNLVVVPGKIKGEQSFLRHKNQSPGPPGSTLVSSPSQLSDRNSRVRVRISKPLSHEVQSGGDFIFASCLPHDALEPSCQFNGNHPCSL